MLSLFLRPYPLSHWWLLFPVNCPYMTNWRARPWGRLSPTLSVPLLPGVLCVGFPCACSVRPWVELLTLLVAQSHSKPLHPLILTIFSPTLPKAPHPPAADVGAAL